MISCKEASYLASKKLDTKLNWREKFDFSLHLIVCVICRQYAKQLKYFHGLVKTANDSSVSILPHSTKLSSQARDRIKKILDKALKETK